MKLFTSIAASAVIGASMIVVSPAAEAGRNCSAGTSYHKIKRGLLLARKTVAEGCFNPYEAAQLNLQADRNENQRRANVIRNINANDQTQCFGSATTNGNNTYGTATCF